MVLALMVLVPVLAFSAWAFYRCTPSATGHDMQRYNGTAVLVGALLCVGWSVRTHHQMVGTVDRPWWPVVSILGSMVIFPVWLGLAGVLRSVIFPDRPAPGSPGGGR
jgi:hypothetical protein